MRERTQGGWRHGAVAVAAAMTAWGVVVLGVFAVLDVHASRPGVASDLTRWPEGARIGRDAARPTLVMFAHPMCPCTRASMAELAEVVAREPGAMQVEVVVPTPENAPPGWLDGDLWRAAQRISGAHVTADPGGVEAAKFGAVTSGQVFLFASGGDMLFAGGITGGRGHRGDNPGLRALRTALGGRGDTRRWPVYGCPVVNACMAAGGEP